MHETVFSRQILKLIEKKSAEIGEGVKISAVNAYLSPFSQVTPETLKEAFRQAGQGTAFEEIALNIKLIEVECSACGEKFVPQRDKFSCPACKNENLKVQPTPEYFVESLEVEK